ncbi:hypothetical protein CU633_10215, partial [Bacillus sp. V3-13]|uniref:hypothetical protein n=1 Tax=Bacillus sp. V3-13 TaxID=2053728 RepID=UPI000CA8315E
RNSRFTSGTRDLRAELEIYERELEIYERNSGFTSGTRDLRAETSRITRKTASFKPKLIH